ISNGLGTTILEWETQGDMAPAQVSMSGVTEGERDRLVFELEALPLPIIHKDFSINIRALEASRSRGQPLDTAQAELAMRLVMEEAESMLYNGKTSLTAGGKTIYGLVNHPDRNTGTAADWENVATAGTTKVANVLSMIAKAHEDNMYGPFGIFVTQAAFTLLAEDYKSE